MVDFCECADHCYVQSGNFPVSLNRGWWQQREIWSSAAVILFTSPPTDGRLVLFKHWETDLYMSTAPGMAYFLSVGFVVYSHFIPGLYTVALSFTRYGQTDG